jgi:spermidine synthase
MWSFQYGLKGSKHPKSISQFDEIQQFVSDHGLRYYNGDVHVGSFATPNFVKTLIESTSTTL